MSWTDKKDMNMSLVRRTAFDCILRCGINHVNVEMVAEESGLSIRSIRRYYRNKDDMLCDCIQNYGIDRYNDMCEKLQSQTPRDLNGLQQLKYILYELYDVQHIYPGGISPWLVIAEVEMYIYENKMPQEILEPYIEKLHSNRKFLADTISLGIEDGSICRDIDPSDAADAIAYAYIGMLQRLGVVNYSGHAIDPEYEKKLVEAHISGVLDRISQ